MIKERRRQRDRQVNMRFSDEEYRKIKGLALIDGLRVSEYVRYLLIRHISNDKKKLLTSV